MTLVAKLEGTLLNVFAMIGLKILLTDEIIAPIMDHHIRLFLLMLIALSGVLIFDAAWITESLQQHKIKLRKKDA